MSNEMKDHLRFAITSAETQGLNYVDKVEYIRNKMQEIYGGSWTVNGSGNGKIKSGTYAYFVYDNKKWIIFENGS